MLRQKGLSLLEVMIALLVLTLVLGGVVHAVGAYASNQQKLRDRTLAQWVAMNRLAEARLDLITTETEPVSGSDRMGRQVWQWSAQAQAIDPQLRRITIEVRSVAPQSAAMYRTNGLDLIELAED